MRVIEASAEIIEIEKISRTKMMEMSGRICYRSEDKINPESAEDFIKGVIKKKHWSVTEFAIFTLVVEMNEPNIKSFLSLQHKYLTIDSLSNTKLIITGTVRGFREAYEMYHSENVMISIINDLTDKYPIFFKDLKVKKMNKERRAKLTIVDPSEIDNLYSDYHTARHRWAMVKYKTNRAVSHELVRHRPVSWLQESQRYCRYSDEKFGNEVTFIDPRKAFDYFNTDENPPEGTENYRRWEHTLKVCEDQYLAAIEKGASPQAARTMLPNSCKTELIQLCNLEEWEIFFKLRTSPKAEPSMRELTIPLYEEFKKRWPTIFI